MRQNETEHSTWMLLLTGKTVHRWWSELSVAPSGQKTKQSQVADEYVRGGWRHKTANRSCTTYIFVHLFSGVTLTACLSD